MKLEMRCLKFQKLLTAVLCLMLLTIFSPAYAAEVSASVLPVSMISAGDGTITITLKNTKRAGGGRLRHGHNGYIHNPLHTRRIL